MTTTIVPDRTDRLPALKFDPPVTTEGPLEVKAGVIPLAELQRQRMELLDRYRVLKARYGPGATFDAQRRAYRAVISVEIRDAKRTAGEKVTETLLEDLACADARYLSYLDNAEREQAELAVLDARMTMLEEAYNRGQAELRAYAAEWRATGA